MDAELKEVILHWLKKIETVADKGGDFVLENAPETVRQYVQFTVVENLVLAVFLFALICGCVFLCRKCGKALSRKDIHSSEEPPYIFGFVASGIAIIPFVTFLVTSVHRFLLAWLAPNVFILKELKNLIS